MSVRWHSLGDLLLLIRDSEEAALASVRWDYGCWNSFAYPEDPVDYQRHAGRHDDASAGKEAAEAVLFDMGRLSAHEMADLARRRA